MAAALSQRAEAQYLQLQEELAEAYGVENIARTFAVEPTHAQELNDQITEKADFLGVSTSSRSVKSRARR